MTLACSSGRTFAASSNAFWLSSSPVRRATFWDSGVRVDILVDLWTWGDPNLGMARGRFRLAARGKSATRYEARY